MNVYDFDGTLYRGDSTRDFLFWCARRHPRVIFTLPRSAVAAVGCFALHAFGKTRFKASLYRFLTCVPDIEGEVERFWQARTKRIQGPCHPAAGDLVISAGPEFLLRGICTKRGLKLIASQVDPHTGRVLGPNCSGAEKVKRFQAQFPDDVVERFYSDSHNDDPLAAVAQNAFMVNIPENKLVPWQSR